MIAAIDPGAATVIAAAVAAAGAVAAAAIGAVGLRRNKHVERKADQARVDAAAAADSVRPNGRGTVIELLERLEDQVLVLAQAEQADQADHQQLHDRVSAVVALIAHYLGPAPPGLQVPPGPGEPPRPRRRPPTRGDPER